MQPPDTVFALPFRQEPRKGQKRVFEALTDHDRYLNIQLPTGYGKTFTALGCYTLKQRAGDVNRLLVIFPSDAQLDQFEKDCKSDSSDAVKAAISGSREAVDIRFFGADAIRKHKLDRAQIFVITVQALIENRGMDNVRLLMQTGRWMIVVDEYHHYGREKTWGKTVRSLPASFLLAMSATPERADGDSAFGAPHVKVSYRDAEREGAVKRLECHAYHYRIDMLEPDGTIRSFTTDELIQEAGSDSPEVIERWSIERKMRWSPKYVSGLVRTPIERMVQKRTTTGRVLQVLVGAMCVSHAELVCDQIRSWFPELRVDWVGTGPNGRTKQENDAVLEKFCPQKNSDGDRRPSLDVLVHVGMAGEGLDSIYVIEVVHLNRASKNNSNDQENGRAARRLLAADGSSITGCINVDSASEYARFVGPAIMDAMDGNEPSIEDEEPSEPGDPRDLPPLPEQPAIAIYNMELEFIDSGEPGVQRMAAVLAEKVGGFTRADLDPASPSHDALIDGAIRVYLEMRRRDAEAENSKSVVMQWNDQVNNALGTVTARAIRLIVRNGERPERSLAGDLRKRINTRKKISLGSLTRDVEVCKLHWRWLQNLDRELIDRGLPSWLS